MFEEPQNGRWEPEMRIWNQRYMANMVRANTDITKYNTESVRQMVRSGDI